MFQNIIANRFLSSLFLIFSFLCVPVSAASAVVSAATTDPMTTDPRHILVRKVKADFATEITARQAALGTANSAVALVDIAREYLERGIASPSDYIPSNPDWSLVIHHVLSGYGYDRGVAETLRTTDDEQLVISKAFAFSSAYLAATGQESTIVDGSIFGNPAEVLEVVATLNRLAALVPAEIQEFAQENVARLGGLAQLRTFNAWFAHERFWGVAGVLDPKTPGQVRSAFTGCAATPFGFVTDLTAMLDYAIKAMAAAPEAQSVVDLLQLSQQILLTLAAGTPGDADGAWVRLNPTNAGEWEIIRKALFLALSVTSNPETAGNTFLSTLYSCGDYYHKKTEPDDKKTYYWRVEALAKGFSKVWDGLKAAQADGAIQAQLADLLVTANPGIEHEKFVADANRARAAAGNAPHPFSVERGQSHSVLMAAYDASIKAISLAATRSELAASLALHPKLQHESAFHGLYPDLINWVTYHEPSPRARELVTGAVVRLALPDGFTPQGIQLVYQGGKWILKALQLSATGVTTGEAILWRQGASATETLVGELVNNQGRHLFSFDVNGAGTTIKAISSGYITKVGGDGANVSVANGQALGIIESSAYPIEVDIISPENTSAISISGAAYGGARGTLVASRGSVWVNAMTIDTKYWQGFETKTHNGKSYQFFSPRGHGFEASKNVVVQGKNVVMPFSTIIAGQDVRLLYHPGATDKTEMMTHGSYIKAGGEIEIDHTDWWGDTQTVFAGSDGSGYVQNPADLTGNSARSVHEFGRCLKYVAWNILFLNAAERDALARGAHVYGTYLNFGERMPRFVPPPPPPPVERSYRSSGGGYGYGFGGSSRPSFERYGGGRVMFSQPSFAPASSLSISGFDFAASTRGGVSSVGASVTLSSMMGGMHAGSTTLGFDFRSGGGGRALDLRSTHTPLGLSEFVRMGASGIDPMQTSSALQAHMAASAMILQATAPRAMNCGPLILVGGAAAAVNVADKVVKIYRAAKVSYETVRTLGTIYSTVSSLEEAREAWEKSRGDKKEEAKEKEGASSAAAGTGGPLPDPDDGDGKFKKSNFEKGDKIDVSRFSSRVSQSSGPAKLEDPKSGEYLVKDLAAGSGKEHGGSYWKLFSKSGERVATFTQEGVFLRK
jgi:hypothetical protein